MSNLIKQLILFIKILLTFLIIFKIPIIDVKAQIVNMDNNVNNYNELNLYKKEDNNYDNDNEQSIDYIIENMLDKLELSEIDNESQKSNITFSDILIDTLKGGEKVYFSVVVDELVDTIKSQFATSKNQLKTLFILAVFSAFIVNIQNTFSKIKTGDTVFYMIFLVVVGILFSEFIQILKIAQDTSVKVVEFMKVLFPAYFLSVSFGNGLSVSGVYYEIAIFIMWLIINVIVAIILKIASLHIFVSFINEITDNMFGKMADVIKKVVEYSLKIIIVIVSGLNVIKTMTAPISLAKKNVALNIIKMLPGAGNVASNISDTVTGAGAVLKNAIGLSALVVVIAIMLVPIIKIAIYICVYMLISAITEPLADKRLINIISKTAESGVLVLKCLVSVGIIFFITIAIVSISI